MILSLSLSPTMNKLTVNTKLEGIRRVLSPQTNGLLKMQPSPVWSDTSDLSESDDETHASLLWNDDLADRVKESTHKPFLDVLMKRKSLVYVAPCNQRDSLFVPKDETTLLQIIDFRPRFFFARSETGYLSIRATNDDGEPKAYFQYKNVRRNKVFVLQDDCQEPLALCLPDGRDLNCKSAYTIYSRRPLENDDSDLEVVQHEGATFYPWVRVVVKTDKDEPKLQVWNSGDFCDEFPSPESLSRDMDDGTVVADNSSTKRCRSLMSKGEAYTYVGSRQQGQVGSSAISKKRGGWNVTVQTGADPAMILCLTVVLGEVLH